MSEEGAFPLSAESIGSPVRGLYGMIDRSAAPYLSHLAIAEALLNAGVRVLQLRDKDASDQELRDLLVHLAPLIASHPAHLVLNDRVSLAAEFEGLGVHLGQTDSCPREARRILGDAVLIGWSTHDIAQVQAAQSFPVDYLGFGPVFDSAGKHRSRKDKREPLAACGTALLGDAVQASALPIVAIGGISEDNLDEVLSAGVAGVATIGAVTQATNMAETAKRLHRRCLSER